MHSFLFSLIAEAMALLPRHAAESRSRVNLKRKICNACPPLRRHMESHLAGAPNPPHPKGVGISRVGLCGGGGGHFRFGWWGGEVEGSREVVGVRSGGVKASKMSNSALVRGLSTSLPLHFWYSSLPAPHPTRDPSRWVGLALHFYLVGSTRSVLDSGPVPRLNRVRKISCETFERQESDLISNRGFRITRRGGGKTSLCEGDCCTLCRIRVLPGGSQGTPRRPKIRFKHEACGLS
jgi:hypothetical protein